MHRLTLQTSCRRLHLHLHLHRQLQLHLRMHVNVPAVSPAPVPVQAAASVPAPSPASAGGSVISRGASASSVDSAPSATAALRWAAYEKSTTFRGIRTDILVRTLQFRSVYSRSTPYSLMRSLRSSAVIDFVRGMVGVFRDFRRLQSCCRTPRSWYLAISSVARNERATQRPKPRARQRLRKLWPNRKDSARWRSRRRDEALLRRLAVVQRSNATAFMSTRTT
jgi:hypothetical protein